MAFGNIKKERLFDIVKNLTEEDIVQACNYIKTEGLPYHRQAATAFVLFDNDKYPLKYTLEIANNIIKNNPIQFGPKKEITPDTWTSFDVLKELFPNPTNFKIVTPYNSEGQKLAESYKEALLDYALELGLNLDDTPKEYIAVKLIKNIAEIHNVKNAKFRMIIKYDDLAEQLKKDVKKLPETYRWTLDGEMYIKNERSLEKAKEILYYLANKQNVTSTDNIQNNVQTFNIQNLIKDLYWYQAIGLSMYLNGKNKSYKVKELEKQPIIVRYSELKDSQNVYLTISAQLQIHTGNDSKFVNYTKKTPPAIFDKNENAEWYLTEIGIKYIESELSEYIEKLNNPELYAEKRETVHYWMLSAGENALWWNDFRENSIIAINWSSYNLGDLTQYKSKLEIRNKLKEQNPKSSNVNNALCCWQFANEMQEGDIVYIKGKQTQILGRGIVKSQYIYDDTRSECKHTRAVEWTHTGEWESETKWAIKTLTDITQYTEDVEKLENLFNIEIEEQTETFDQYTEEDFLNDVFIDKSQYEILRNLLLNKKNLILQGAPGVGKTYAAKRLAYSILGEKDTNKVKIIQFHQSYGYEDFIMGFRPKENGFELVNGPFYKFCKNAEENPDDKFFFIIDEINRGKLSKIFGELLMLIEPDKRGQSLRLLYRDEEFSVPENLYIIGMMNTADRSIAMIDYALRRRFAFYDFKPAFETESFIRYKEKFNNKKYNALIDEITKLNKEISDDCSLGSGFQIGHSYFCNNKEINDEWLNSVVDYEIIPLLKEYWFDEQSKIETWTNNLKNAIK